MGAAESAQRDGIPEDDAKVQDNVEENAEEADQNLEVKVNEGIHYIVIAFRYRL